MLMKKRIALAVWVFLACMTLSCSACPNGWFGLKCQYKCRCTENKCNQLTGTCFSGANCQLGWFGPACQYADLAQSYTANHDRLRLNSIIDGNENTCFSGKELTMSLTVPLQLSWFRAHVKESYFLNKLTIQFKERIDSPLLACENKRTAPVSDTALDIHCDLDVMVTQVILTGESVQALCSFYISGGRNVALRQHATQSSTFYVTHSEASSGVDGNTNGIFLSGSCTHTTDDDENPTWNVTFFNPRAVNRYVIYNRDEGGHVDNRLIGFHLRSYDSAGAEVFHFTDRSTTEQIVYTVRSLTTEVQTVSINVKTILTLCEVEVYGDSVCAPGLYGRDCEHKCSCADINNTCFVSTGGCPSGCASGFHGESCDQVCRKGTHGPDCGRSCSQFCRTDDLSTTACDRVHGACLHGCIPGYSGSMCNEECENGHYGQDCNATCPWLCLANTTSEQRVCHHVDGTCLQGCKAGYLGPLCDETCSSGTYGHNCSSVCSPLCEVGDMRWSVCDHIHGACLLGCQAGYLGSVCDKLCDNGSYGPDCSLNCPEHCKVRDMGHTICHHTNGTCLQGCQDGYVGPTCNQSCDRGTYGADCTLSCSQFCVKGDVGESVCNHTDGGCLRGCQTGYQGLKCDEQCDRQTHGQGCNSTCPQHCENMDTSLPVCHHISGVCTQGCLPGYKGDRCGEPVTDVSRTVDDSPWYSTTLWTVSGFMVVVVVGLIVLYRFKTWRSFENWITRRKNLQKSGSSEIIVTTEMSTVANQTFMDSMLQNEMSEFLLTVDD